MLDKIQSVTQFLNRLTDYYGASFKNENDKEIWKDCTLDEIYNPSVDYDKAFKLILKRSYNGNFVPDISQILEATRECFKPETVKSRIKQVRFYNSITKETHCRDAFEGEMTEKQMIEWKTAKTKQDGWQVIEVY